MDFQSLKGEVVLVANAPVQRDWGPLVDAADNVVRFNFCESYGAGTGSKTDWVAINNVGQPAIKMLHQGLPGCAKDAKILFSRCAETHYKYYNRCKIHEFPKSLVSVERAFVHCFKLRNYQSVRAEQYCDVFDRLIDFDGDADFVMPSVGFAVLECIAKARGCDVVSLVGFTFEGWEGHPWSKEKKIAEAYQREGWLRFLH